MDRYNERGRLREAKGSGEGRREDESNAQIRGGDEEGEDEVSEDNV